MKTLSILFCLFATSVLASTTGTLVLSGVVPSILTLEVNAEAVASNLDLETTQVDLNVGELVVSSNSNTGYQVSVASDNLGQLDHSSESSNIPYTLKVDGSLVDLSNGDTIVGSGNVSGLSQDLEISYTGVPHSSL